MYIRTSSFVSLETPLQFIVCILQGFVDPKCNINHTSEWFQNIEPFQLSATLKLGAPLKVTSTNQAPRPADQ